MASGSGLPALGTAGRSLVGLRLPGPDPAHPLELVEHLGRGRSASVYRARCRDAEYAVKLLDDDRHDGDEGGGGGGGGQGAERAFRREASLLACVDHPGLPRVHSVGVLDGRHYLVMDFVRGRTLAHEIAGGPLPVERVLRIGLELACTLTSVHAVGLVHRDVKPDNVLIAPDAHAQLIDFGLAGAAGAADQAVGTLTYCSPEQAGTLQRDVDGRADLYSLGVLLHECLAGVPPFVSADPADLLVLHVRQPPPDLHTLRPDVPDAVAGVVRRLLAKDPDDRFAGAGALADALRGLVAGTGPAAEDRTPPGRPPGRTVGRGDELGALGAVWSRARDGRGAMALVQGPSGSGKSHLAGALAGRARADGALVLAAKGELDGGAPLSSLRTAVEDAVAWLTAQEPGRRDDVVARLRAGLGPAVGLLPLMSPALAALLGAPVEAGDQDQDQQFPAAVAGFLTTLAEVSGGLLLHLDDVQWIDEVTARVVEDLARDAASTRVLAVLTARDDDASRQAVADLLARAGDAVELRLALAGLTPDEVADLVATSTAGIRLDRTSSQALAQSAAGNPFTVLQYLRAMIEGGLLRPVWGTWAVDAEALHGLELPLDAASLVLSRLDDLDPSAREVLATAAVLGARFERSFLAGTAAVPPAQIEAVLRTAVQRSILSRAGDGAHRFVHDRIREALLASIDPARTRELHDRAADVLDQRAGPAPGAGEHAYALAAHCRTGTPGNRPDRLYRACLRAGQLALDDHTPGLALELLEAACAAADAVPVDVGAPLLVSLGTAQHRVGRFREAAATFERARTAAAPGMERAGVLHLLARVHDSTWSTEEQAAAVDAALAELGAVVPAGPVRLVLTTAALALGGLLLLPVVRLGHGPAGRSPGRPTDSARRDRLRLLTALHEAGALACARNLQPRRALVLLLRSLWPAHRLGPSPQTARIWSSMAHLLFVLGLHRAAEAVSAAARRMGEGLRDARLGAYLAWVEAFDRYSFGLDQGERLRAVWSEHQRWLDVGAAHDLHLVLCWDALMRGDLERAGSVFVRRRQLVASRSDRSGRTADHPMDAALLALQGRVAEAMAHLASMRRHADLLWAQVDIVVAGTLVAVELHELGGFVDELGALLDRLDVDPRALIPSQRALFAYLAHARLAQCRDPVPLPREERLAQAAAAVATLRSLANTPILRAHAAVAAAELAQARGRPSDALAALDRSAAVLRAVDAPLIAHEAARIRARACRGLDLPGEADRWARHALLVATTQGWPQRARRTAEEFGLDEPAGSSGSTTSRGPGTVTAHLLQQRLSAVEQVSAAAAQVLDPRTLTRIALDETIRVLGAERAFLFLLEGDPPRLVPGGGRDAQGGDLPVLDGYTTTLVERVLQTGREQVFTGTEQGAVDTGASVAAHGLRSVLAAPLALDARLLGVVYVDSRVARGIFSADDAALLTTIARYVAIALENARASELTVQLAAATRERDVAQTLRRALVEMSGRLDPQHVVHHLLTSLRLLLGADAAWLGLRDPSGAFTWTSSAGFPALVDDPEDDVVAALLAAPATVGEAGAAAPPCVRELAGAASWLSAPLVVRDGRVGVAVLASRRPDAFADQTELATALVAEGALAYENAQLFRTVERLASTDGLTGVANRRHVLERAEERLSGRRPGDPEAAVVMVDLDHFKAINDTHGHPVGDEVLVEVARRLADRLPGPDLVGRYGGEEFVVLAEGDAADVGERLRRAVAGAPVRTAAGPLQLTVSVGATRVEAGDTLAAAVSRADAALYRAKHGGRDRVVVHAD